MFRKLVAPCGLHCIRMTDIGVTIGGVEILKNINLHIHCGNLAAVIGKNGAGKSTLIKAILGDIEHTGKIEFTMHDKNTVIRNKNMQLRIGYVPQSLNIEKKTPISVYDMIACYQSAYPVFLKKSRALYAKILKALEIFKAEGLIDKQVCNLSGGELQRVLLAMAVMDEPDLLLLDEPVSGIDQNGMDLFYQTIDGLKRQYDLAVILISHDLDYVAKYADQVILLDDKTVACQGDVRHVYESPEFERVFGGFDLENYKPMRRSGKMGERRAFESKILNRGTMAGAEETKEGNPQLQPKRSAGKEKQAVFYDASYKGRKSLSSNTAGSAMEKYSKSPDSGQDGDETVPERDSGKLSQAQNDEEKEMKK